MGVNGGCGVSVLFYLIDLNITIKIFYIFKYYIYIVSIKCYKNNKEMFKVDTCKTLYIYKYVHAKLFIVV